MTDDRHGAAHTGLAVGRWRLLEPIGEGGMGVIWRACRADGAQGSGEVAVKVLARRHVADERQRQRLVREIQAAARLEHPCIVRVLDHGVVGGETASAALPAGVPWLAMELADGGSLREQTHAANWEEVASRLLALLDALAYAHARGLVHRDLKPANVLLSSGHGGSPPGVLLSDFGLAHATIPERTARLATIDAPHAGTPAYMAPEQFDGDWRNYGPWTDLYALGCVAWELVCGRPPFVGNSVIRLAVAHLREPLPALRPRFAVPHGLEAWLARMLAKSPMDRTQCAADAAWALAQLGPAVPRAVTLEVETGDFALDSTTTLALDSWRSERGLTAVHGGLHSDPTHAELGRAPAAVTASNLAVATPRSVLTAAEEVPPMPEDWRSARPARVRSGAPSLFGLREVPLVAREPERDALWSALTEVRREQRPRVVLIEAASGVGKSRLARWLVERAHEVGAATVSLHAHHSPTHAPHDALQRMIAVHLRTLGLTVDEARLHLEGWLARLGPVAEQLGLDLPLEHLCTLACDGASDACSALLALGDARRDRLVERVVRLAAWQRPAIVWLDDVQWGLAALELALSLLEPSAPPAAVLVVATLRSEALADRPFEAACVEQLRGHPGVECVCLEPLEAAALAELVDEVADVEPALASAVVERTEGTPLFALHLLAELIESAQRPPGLLDEGLPPGLESLWERRLERLVGNRGERVTALGVAALLGTHVETSLWCDSCRRAGLDEALLDERLESLVSALVGARLASRVLHGWAFVHDQLTRWLVARVEADAVEGPRLHLACADALRAHPRYGRAEHVERRIHHQLAAGDLAGALDELERGLSSARYLFRSEFTVRLVERYEALLDAHAPGPDDRRRVWAWLQRARHQLRNGQVDAAEAAAERALAALEHAGDSDAIVVLRADAWLVFGAALSHRARLHEAIESMARGEALLRSIGDTAGADRVLLCQVSPHMLLGELERAREALERLIARSEARQDQVVLMSSLSLLGELESRQGRLDDARATLQRALGVARRISSYTFVGELLITLGNVERMSGRHAEAEETYRQAVRHIGEDNARCAFVVRLNLAIARLEQAHHAAAEHELGRLLAEPLAADLVVWRLFATIALLACTARRDDAAASALLLDEAEALFATTGATDPDGVLCATLAAEALAEHGHAELAERAHRLAHAQRGGREPDSA